MSKPLKTNDRWKRDDSTDEKKEFSRNTFRSGGRYQSGRGGRGGRGGRNRSRAGEYNRYMKRYIKPKPKDFVFQDKDFPVFGKSSANLKTNLNWRQAAQKGTEAPPPCNFIKKMPEKKNDFSDIDLDDFDEKEYDSDLYCSDDDTFPVKGGYID